MSELPIEPPEPDPVSLGAALVMADLQEAVAEAAGQIAALSGALSGFHVAPPAPPMLQPPAPAPVGAAAAEPAAAEASVPATLGAWPSSLSGGGRDTAGWPAAIDTEARSRSASVRPDEPPSATSTIRVSGPASGSAIASQSSPPSPVATPPVAVDVPVSWASPAPGLATAPVTAAAFSQPIASIPGWPDRAGSSAGPPVAPASPWEGPAADDATADAPDMSAAAPVAPGGSRQAPVASAMSGSFESAAPPPRDGGGPTSGDVFLDGARVGRWLADTLAREAGGPATGATGFDPRLGPTWAGALQGNGT